MDRKFLPPMADLADPNYQIAIATFVIPGHTQRSCVRARNS
jgi:hypothetical protein